MIKKLTQGMADQNKALAAAKTEEEKDAIVSFTFSFTSPSLAMDLFPSVGANLAVIFNLQKTQKLNATFALRACNNILAMTQVKSADFAFCALQSACYTSSA